MLSNSEFNILIVDDEKFNIEVVAGFLEEESYSLSFASNGKNALKGAFSKEFDLILLDINMPEMDGFEVCRRLKNDEKTKDIPIIFLSAYNDVETITEAFKFGAVDYISKPLNGLELIARVKTHIQLRKLIKELKAKQEKLAQLVAIDIHTRLPNRLRFITKLKSTCESVNSDPTRVSLAYIKIDNMFKINDIYGHKNGDRIISKLAKLLKANIREDDMVARLLGSEFVILMKNTSLEAAGNITKKFYNKVIEKSHGEVKLTCSIGVVELIYKENYNSFLCRAEKLMLDTKSQGGDMVSIRAI